MGCGFRKIFEKAFMDKGKEGPDYRKQSPASIPVAIEEEIIPRLLMAHRLKATVIGRNELKNTSLKLPLRNKNVFDVLINYNKCYAKTEILELQ